MTVSVCLSVSVCVSVCLSVRKHISGNTLPSFPGFFLCVLHTVARSSSGGFAICYVLPVLWMTSYLPISQGSSTWPPSSWKRRNTRCVPLTGLHFGRRGLGLPVVVLHIYDVMFGMISLRLVGVEFNAPLDTIYVISEAVFHSQSLD